MLIKGVTINEGQVEGEAIVSKMPFSFLGDLEVATGRIMAKGHDLQGQSIRGKIFVFPTGKGSTAGPAVAFTAKQKGNVPVGMIIAEAEPVIAMVAIMNDIPMIHRLEKNPVEIIRTGDYVHLDANAGMIEILEKKG